MARKNIVEEKKKGRPPFVKQIMNGRGPVLISPSRLANWWRVPTHVVEQWIAEEGQCDGIVEWKRLKGKSKTRIVYRVTVEVAERLRVKHHIPGDSLHKAVSV